MQMDFDIVNLGEELFLRRNLGAIRQSDFSVELQFCSYIIDLKDLLMAWFNEYEYQNINKF